MVVFVLKSEIEGKNIKSRNPKIVEQSIQSVDASQFSDRVGIISYA